MAHSPPNRRWLGVDVINSTAWGLGFERVLVDPITANYSPYNPWQMRRSNRTDTA
jgi:hypothetical protein